MNILTESHVKFKDLFSDRKGVTTKHQLELLTKSDKLCEKCLLQDNLLCSGTRMVLHEEASVRYNSPKLIMMDCPKKAVVQEAVRQTRAVEDAYIPVDFYNSIKEFLDVDIETVPKTIVETKLDKALYFVSCAVKIGVSAKVLYLPNLGYTYGYKFSNEGANDVTLLALSGFNFKSMLPHQIEEVKALIEYRKVNGKVTLIHLPDMTGVDNDLYVRIKKWKKLEKIMQSSQ